MTLPVSTETCDQLSCRSTMIFGFQHDTVEENEGTEWRRNWRDLETDEGKECGMVIPILYNSTPMPFPFTNMRLNTAFTLRSQSAAPTSSSKPWAICITEGKAGWRIVSRPGIYNQCLNIVGPARVCTQTWEHLHWSQKKVQVKSRTRCNCVTCLCQTCYTDVIGRLNRHDTQGEGVEEGIDADVENVVLDGDTDNVAMVVNLEGARPTALSNALQRPPSTCPGTHRTAWSKANSASGTVIAVRPTITTTYCLVGRS